HTHYNSLISPFLLSLIPRHPTSTLFPYTTLFRSHFKRRQKVNFDRDEILESKWLRTNPRTQLRGPSRFLPLQACIRQCWTATISDRKSTRLNSSHVSISYAVFCLKKKNSK